jgi:hypothetical protein
MKMPVFHPDGTTSLVRNQDCLCRGKFFGGHQSNPDYIAHNMGLSKNKKLSGKVSIRAVSLKPACLTANKEF